MKQRWLLVTTGLIAAAAPVHAEVPVSELYKACLSWEAFKKPEFPPDGNIKYKYKKAMDQHYALETEAPHQIVAVIESIEMKAAEVEKLYQQIDAARSAGGCSAYFLGFAAGYNQSYRDNFDNRGESLEFCPPTPEWLRKAIPEWVKSMEKRIKNKDVAAMPARNDLAAFFHDKAWMARCGRPR